MGLQFNRAGRTKRNGFVLTLRAATRESRVRTARPLLGVEGVELSVMAIGGRVCGQSIKVGEFRD